MLGRVGRGDTISKSQVVQEPLFVPEADWRPTPVDRLPSWEGAKRVGIDVETRDDSIGQKLGPGTRRGGYLIGISFAIEDGPAHYLPFRHEGGDNLDEKTCLAYIKDQLRDFSGTLVGANLSYDIDYLLQYGIVFHPDVVFKDIQIAEPLLDEHQFSYSLEAIAGRHGISGKDENLLREAALAYGLDPKADMWRLPARFVGEYAEQDAVLPLTLLRRQERRIDEEGLWRVFNLECAVTPILVRMTRRGVLIDQDKLQWIDEWAIREELEALALIKKYTGQSLVSGESTTTSIMARILRKEGIKVPQTVPKSETAMPRDSVTNDYLKTLGFAWTNAAVRARKFDKLRTFFVESIKKNMCDGRIHMGYNQLRRTKDDGDTAGAITARLSSCDPNIQQQPSRDPEIAPIWRSIYLPEWGCLWRSADYSQQEPRILIHFAEKANCLRATEFGDRYRNDPETDFHSLTASIANIERKPAKEIGLGSVYGMGELKLCRKLGLPTRKKTSRDGKFSYIGAGPEGDAIIAAFHQGVPFLRDLVKKAKRVATSPRLIFLLRSQLLRHQTIHPSYKDQCNYNARPRIGASHLHSAVSERPGPLLCSAS